jgi:hypothetical protein
MLALLSEIHSGPEVWAPEPLVIETVAKMPTLEYAAVARAAVCWVAMAADLDDVRAHWN